MFGYMATLWGIAFLSFLSFLYAQIVLVERLSSQYTELYKRLGEPWSFWSGPRNFKFVFMFLLAKGFRKEELDKTTVFWCKVGSYGLSIFYLLILIGIVVMGKTT